MVFTEKDLDTLYELYNKYDAFAKEMKAFCDEIGKRSWYKSKPNSDAFKALSQFTNSINSEELFLTRLFCELAYARSKESIDWEEVDELEMMIMEFDPQILTVARKRMVAG